MVDALAWTYYDFTEETMLTKGDFNLNSPHGHPDALKELLKHTMISHEYTFKNQVLELHRLYKKQKTIMQDSSWRLTENFSSWKASTQVVDHKIHHNNQQRPRNCELALLQSGQYIGQDISEKQNLRDFLGLSKDNACTAAAYLGDQDELKLSLCNGKTIKKRSHEEFQVELSLHSGPSTLKSKKCDPSCEVKQPNSSENMHDSLLEFSLSSEGFVDLNRVYFHSGSSCSTDPVIVNSSTASSSPSHNKPPGKNHEDHCPNLGYCPNHDESDRKGSGDIIRGDSAICPAGMESNGEGNSNEICDGRAEMNNMHVETLSSPSPSSELSDRKSDSSKGMGNGELTSESSNSMLMDQRTGISATGDISFEKDEDENKIIDSSCDKICISEVDVSVQTAAESLVLISFASEGSSYGQDKGKTLQPLCSSDSFELNVLGLEESCTDYDCSSASSKAFELDEMSNKEFNLKLRRGRRLKDFQKEILPSLKSLSNHEILEDISTFEGVLRSKEYRKMRAKTADEERQCAPLGRRRSGARLSNRRRYR